MRISFVKLFVCCLLASGLFAESPRTLPGTTLWNFPDDIVAEQYRELRQYYDGQIAGARRDRKKFWEGQDLQKLVSQNREEFRRAIGAIDSFIEPKAKVATIREDADYQVSLVEWPILPLGNIGATGGFSGAIVHQYGILLAPTTGTNFPAVIAVPDATHSAADLAGLTDRLPAARQYARQLAAAGYVVFVPFFTQRRTFSQPWTEDRSWLFRLAYQVGRHLIGSEVQQVSSAIDFLAQQPVVDARRIGVAGYGQGGLTALYAAALDTRLTAALVAGYFDHRERAFEEPEDCLLWTHLVRFGDAEIAYMIAPRTLVIDGGGRGAREEFEEVRSFYRRLAAPSEAVIFTELPGQKGFSPEAVGALAAVLKPQPKPFTLTAGIDADRVSQISNAQFSQWQARFRNLAMEAYAERDKQWKPDTRSVEDYRRWVKPKLADYFDVIGEYPQASGPLEAKSVKLYDEAEFSGYRLSVRVYDGVHAYGVLLVPKGMKRGERRPVVFTQHGLRGTPEAALGVVAKPEADRVYSRFGLRLAKRGYIVFAPMISTQDSVERNSLTRRAHLLGLTPVGMELKKFGRVLDYLSTLPYVDPESFAFYGLSYGGYTALWIGPGEPRFKVVVSSGHFNDWNLKTTDLTEGTSFLFYPNSFDMFNFNILHRFNHSELASLVAPRAFMIEIGDRDGIVVVPRRFVDLEMERVEDLYRKLQIPERGRVARFDGPHKVDGTEAFPFLDRWLNWTPTK